MEEKMTLDTLTIDSVSLKKQNITTIAGKEYLIGEPWRRSYVNSTEGRIQVQLEIVEPYLSAIMAMWGDSATVVENVEVATE